ncbi:MAG: TRAP transporter substrate-binding protein DctP [Ardenticatenaceae bacterium]|nr:TRAP transporter substrate-binding protein DctP [Anaerolineales bacterium]MCB8920565.1 TRAP transporter substrate-binding protein DctP [Ardenticatenaceae bacterium]MCB8990188.1 TRAP transporter substrate-binding protein DctP [Ardenticatenaceae bacterium]MCB9003021.1 TRAP transporter substrate-binding protein DctP [Ardenticatenaceae bacterium]
MKRREFLGIAAKGALGAATIGVVGCSSPNSNEAAEAAQSDSSLPTIDWQMATSWPLALDTIFGGAQVVADRVSAMTNGKFTISPRAAGELAPYNEVLNAVEEGAVPIGHTASYYYTGRSPVMGFGTSVPFGLTARQQNAWLYDGGGLDLLQAFYKDRFGVIQFPAGNTGAQMGGWWNKEIETAADLQGLKVRIPGLGGQVMDRLGATVQVLAGGEIFQALQTGAIDAAEWVGPYDDLKLGLNDAAQYYYAPGWWEPGPTLEIQINLGEWEKLPAEYQEVLKSAAFEANMIMLARYDARNQAALKEIVAGGTQLRNFSTDIMQAAQDASFALYDELAQNDTDFKSIYEQWKEFRAGIQEWHTFIETSYADFIATQFN